MHGFFVFYETVIKGIFGLLYYDKKGLGNDLLLTSQTWTQMIDEFNMMHVLFEVLKRCNSR